MECLEKSLARQELNLAQQKHNIQTTVYLTSNLGLEQSGSKSLRRIIYSKYYVLGLQGLICTYHLLPLSTFFQYDYKVCYIWSIVINEERFCKISAIVGWTKVYCLYCFLCVQGQKLKGSLDYICNYLKSCWKLTFQLYSTEQQNKQMNK